MNDVREVIPASEIEFHIFFRNKALFCFKTAKAAKVALDEMDGKNYESL